MEKPAETSCPIHDPIQQRWSPRSFSDRPVEKENLIRIFEAARWASSCFNEQPWQFIVATKGDPEEYERMLSCLVEGNQEWAKLAPVLILTVAKSTFDHNAKGNPHAWHDVGLAVGNLVIQATTLGLSLHQMAGILPDRIREVYGVPQGFEPVTALALGYAGDPTLLPDELCQREQAPRTRKPLSELVFSETWGQTASIVK
ncbi:MAG: nitroreductase family protein [Nitrospirae bacterium]|nr:nitroreductase family protein [Nitrospirota bacterium]MDA1302957.1 nitroreductase family protein [Nitrospirota bacterium]